MYMNMESNNQAATLQFFIVLEKGKPIRVLPALVNLEELSVSEMAKLPLQTILSSKIVLPLDLKPWSDISQEADHFFLMTQSRLDWGGDIKPGMSLLRLDSVRKLVESMEQSLNNYSWREDLLSGKFSSPHISLSNIPRKEIKDYVEPGSSW